MLASGLHPSKSTSNIVADRQQTASLVRTADGLLLCIFSHKDGWPRNASDYDGWTTKSGQRFIASADSGSTWTQTVWELHRGGQYASSVVLPNRTIVTAFSTPKG